LPGEQPAGEVHADDLPLWVAGEEAALAGERAAGDDVLVAGAGEQTEGEGAWSGGSSLSAAARISGRMRTSSQSPASPVSMVSVMTSLS
jgi:hypothetical protein